MPNPAQIPIVLTLLSGYPTSATVNNPYSSPRLVNNLKRYFDALISYPYSDDLLVGEAPGYAGCALTGIAFTSERLITSSSHPFLTSLRPHLSCTGIQTEKTATMVWKHLVGGKKVPALWNAFPFHPHPLGKPRKNRKPTVAEAMFGATILSQIINILTPKRVFAIGRVAEAALSTYFPGIAVDYIRHPSNGGLSAFVSGMNGFKIV